MIHHPPCGLQNLVHHQNQHRDFLQNHYLHLLLGYHLLHQHHCMPDYHYFHHRHLHQLRLSLQQCLGLDHDRHYPQIHQHRQGILGHHRRHRLRRFSHYLYHSVFQRHRRLRHRIHIELVHHLQH